MKAPAKPVYKCGCGVTFKPPHFPYKRRCSTCGAVITVVKPTS